jgi:hypothetical protein
MQSARFFVIGLMLAAAVFSQTKNQTRTPAHKPAATHAQPYGLKGDVLGETIEEFRTKNERSIPLGLMGKDRSIVMPDLPAAKHLPQCSGDSPESDLSPDIQSDYESAEEKRAGVVKCIASLSIDDDMDYDDRPTIAGAQAYRTVYYFFQRSSSGQFREANPPKRLYMIRSTLPGTNYQEIRDAFVEKYGTPMIRVAQYQNGFGAKIEGEELLWTTEVSQISIGQRDGEPDDPSVTAAKDNRAEIASDQAATAAIGKGYAATRTAAVYGQVLTKLRAAHRVELGGSNVLVTIWDTALRRQCEAVGSAKDRAKDL